MLTLEMRLADITGVILGGWNNANARGCKGPFLKNRPRMVHCFGLVGLSFFSCGAVGYSLFLEETPCSEPFSCSAYILDMFGKSTKQKWLMHGNLHRICIIYLSTFGCGHWFTIASSRIFWKSSSPKKSWSHRDMSNEKRAPGRLGYIGDKIMS